MLSRASNATETIRGSDTPRRSHKGLTQPLFTRNAICCLDPPLVAFVIADVENKIRKKTRKKKRKGKKKGKKKLTPCGFFLYIVFTIAQQSNKGGDDVAIDHGLNLVLGPSGDVRDGPASFLLDSLLRGIQESQQRSQNITFKHGLSLVVVSSHHVTQGPQRRCFN